MITWSLLFISIREQGLKLKSADVKSSKQLFKEVKAIDYIRGWDSSRGRVSGQLCPPPLPNPGHTCRAVGHPSRAFFYISGMLLVELTLLKLGAFSPRCEMVREKGRKPGGGEGSPWLSCLVLGEEGSGCG